MSQFNVNLDVVRSCTQHGLGVDQFIILQGLQDSAYLELPSALLQMKGSLEKALIMQGLIRKGFVISSVKDHFEGDFKFENYELTDLGDEICSKKLVEIEVNDKTIDIEFLQKYVELFPLGKNAGNKTLRVRVEDLSARMKEFFRKYKYDKETVLKATEKFLKGFRGDYSYCPTSFYFIKKDGQSALAAECESLGKSSQPTTNITRF